MTELTKEFDVTYVSAPSEDLSETTDEEYLAEYRDGHETRMRDRGNPWLNGQAPTPRPQALRLIGEVLYAVRTLDGLIKIGWTRNLGLRLIRHDLTGSTLLALRAGDRPAEQVVHDSLAAHVHHGREWYYPTPGVMAIVNDWRSALGLPNI